MNPELEFSPERMREIGYRVVDRLVEHLATLPDTAVGAKGDPAVLIPSLQRRGAGEGRRVRDGAGTTGARRFTNTMHVNHPRFFAYVPGPGNFVSAMADALISGYNMFAGTWISGSGPAAVELTVDGLAPPSLRVAGEARAGFSSAAEHGEPDRDGGGAACHAAGQHRRPCVYYSDQAHSSLEKALRLIASSRGNIRKLPADADFRLSIRDLKQTVDQDRAAGLRPFCVIANAGTTNTGAVDPLPRAARLLPHENFGCMWTAPMAQPRYLAARARRLLAGLELARLTLLDPHKWLFQPFEIGCVLVRDLEHLRDTFRILPEYLKDTHQHSAEFNFTDYGLQLPVASGRLKLWMSIKVFGMASFRAAIERGFALGELPRHASPNARMGDRQSGANGVVCFRYHTYWMTPLICKPGATLLEDGFALITSTVLRARTVLRIAPSIRAPRSGYRGWRCNAAGSWRGVTTTRICGY